MIHVADTDFRVGWSKSRKQVMIGIFAPGSSEPSFAFGIDLAGAKRLAAAILLEVKRRSADRSDA